MHKLAQTRQRRGERESARFWEGEAGEEEGRKRGVGRGLAGYEGKRIRCSGRKKQRRAYSPSRGTRHPVPLPRVSAFSFFSFFPPFFSLREDPGEIDRASSCLVVHRSSLVPSTPLPPASSVPRSRLPLRIGHPAALPSPSFSCPPMNGDDDDGGRDTLVAEIRRVAIQGEGETGEGGKAKPRQVPKSVGGLELGSERARGPFASPSFLRKSFHPLSLQELSSLLLGSNPPRSYL